MRAVSFLLAIGAVVSPAMAGEGSNGWFQFRGPQADGISSESGVLPSGAYHLETAWKVEIGSAYSGVSIGEGKVVTGFSDGEKDWFVCFGDADGKEAWRHEIGPTYVGHDGSHDGPISTPAIHDGRVFALGPRGKLMALDLETGSVLWLKDLTKAHGAIKPHYGFTTSPLVLDGQIVLQLGAPGAALAAFHPKTGDLVWSCGESTVAYQSAVPLPVDGKLQILAAGMQNILGVDPEKGEVIWDHAHEGAGGRGASSIVPVPCGDRMIFLAHKDEASTVLEIAKDGEGKTSAKPVWENRSIYNSYNVPVYHEGHLYAFSSRRLTCVEAATGEKKWRSRQPGDGFLILVDDHLVVLTKEGSVHVVEATPDEYRPVTSGKVFHELAWSPPSFANGHVYARSLGAIAKVALIPGRGLAEDDLATSRPDSVGFSDLLAKLSRDDTSDKAAVIDAYLAQQESLPLVDGSRVHFVYHGEAKDLAIAGDMIGARQERPMTRVPETDLFYYSTDLEPDARVNYMFIKDYEAIVDPRNPRKTVTTMYTDEMEVGMTGAQLPMSWVSMPEWRKPLHLEEPEGNRRGTTETQQVESATLASAPAPPGMPPGAPKPPSTVNLQVWLPPGYADGERRYPVAYIHGGTQARTLGSYVNTLDNLVGHSVAPVIVVFIELPYFGPMSPYHKVITDEVVPFVDGQYRTIANREARASIGAGFNGVAALQCGLLHADTVGKVATQSAFMMASITGPIEAQLGEANAERPIQLYIEWGKYDMRNPHEAWDMGEGNAKFVAKLTEMGYGVEGGEVNDGAGWSSWKNRTDAILQALFPVDRQ